MTDQTPEMPLLTEVGFSGSQSQGGISRMSDGTIITGEQQQNDNETQITEISNDVNVDNMTIEEKRQKLILWYNTNQPLKLNKETLDSVGRFVRKNIVRNIKFIDNEQTSGLSKEAIDNIRKFPSFWKPDLTTERSIQNDIFNGFPEFSNTTLMKKVSIWMGIREKVIHSIRCHRNTTQTAIQTSVVEGKYCILMIILLEMKCF